MRIALRSSSESDTLAIARALGEALLPGDVVALSGELGAGKTVFVKGVGEALGVPAGRITSPSFTIMTQHRGRMLLNHIDVYRLASGDEARDAGLDEVLGEGQGICLVEWAEKVETLLPKHRLRVTFSILSEDRRLITIAAGDEPRIERFAARCERFLPGGDA